MLNITAGEQVDGMNLIALQCSNMQMDQMGMTGKQSRQTGQNQNMSNNHTTGNTATWRNLRKHVSWCSHTDLTHINPRMHCIHPPPVWRRRCATARILLERIKLKESREQDCICKDTQSKYSAYRLVIRMFYDSHKPWSGLFEILQKNRTNYRFPKREAFTYLLKLSLLRQFNMVQSVNRSISSVLSAERLHSVRSKQSGGS